MLIIHKRLKIEGVCLLNTNRKPWTADKMAMSIVLGTPPTAAEIYILPLRTIENKFLIHNRLKIRGRPISLLNKTRKPWSLEKMATSFSMWDAPLWPNRQAGITASWKHACRSQTAEKRVNSYRKSWSLYILVTSVSAWSARSSGNSHSACKSSENGSQIRYGRRHRVYNQFNTNF